MRPGEEACLAPRGGSEENQKHRLREPRGSRSDTGAGGGGGNPQQGNCTFVDGTMVPGSRKKHTENGRLSLRN